MSRDRVQNTTPINDTTTNRVSTDSGLASLDLSVGKEYNSTRIHNEQVRMIKNVAMNEAKEDDMELCEYLFKSNSKFLILKMTVQKAYDAESTSTSRFSNAEKRAESKIRARRLRIAMRRVLQEDGHLPPHGDPLIPGDKEPEPVHTPQAQRLREEEAAREAREATRGANSFTNHNDPMEKTFRQQGDSQRREAAPLAIPGSEEPTRSSSPPIHNNRAARDGQSRFPGGWNTRTLAMATLWSAANRRNQDPVMSYVVPRNPPGYFGLLSGQPRGGSRQNRL